MKIRTTAVAFLIVLAAAPAMLTAQPAVPQIEQFERTQRESPLKTTPLNLSTNVLAPELYPGENEDVGPQRILKLNPRKTYFEGVADSQYFYTDNALLSDGSKVASVLFVNTIQAAFAPEAYRVGKGQLAPMLGYRSQWFNYDLNGLDGQLNRLDFNAQTAFLNTRYQLGTWQFYGGLDVTRLLNQPDYHEAYREYVPTFAVQKFFPVNDRLIFVIGGQFSYHFTDVWPSVTTLAFSGTNLVSSVTKSDVNDRYDLIANASLSYELLPKLILQPLYRFQYTHYGSFADATLGPQSRVDFIHTVGISVAYYFNRNVSLRAFASYEHKDLDFSSAYDYKKFDAGGGLSLLFRF